MTDTETNGNYGDLLYTQWEDIPEPVDTPEGTWLLRTKVAKFQPKETVEKADGSEINLSDRVMFVYEPKEAMNDVSEDTLAAAADYDFSENPVFHTHWLKRRADWDDLKRHLEMSGVDTSKSIPESLKAVRGTDILGYLKQKTVVRNGRPQVQVNVTAFEPVS